jgi:hypothetical protein
MFDIDNAIIIVLRKNNNAKPIKRKINLINQLYNKSNIIKIFTVRFIRKHN